ncbi:MAG: peptidoglycan-binding domain-containing protein [Candidatus Caenarcaniphilales bacterium]|nr:peptidoglycan-binding domain-containing protein [Candidatus Caenarcaniphilales bacterium]
MSSIPKKDLSLKIKQGLNALAANSFDPNSLANMAAEKLSQNPAVKSDVDSFVNLIKSEDARKDTNTKIAGLDAFLDRLANVDNDGDSISLDENSAEGQIARLFINPDNLKQDDMSQIFTQAAIKNGIVEILPNSKQNTEFRKIASQQGFLRSKEVEIPINGVESPEFQQAVSYYNDANPDNPVPEYFQPDSKNEVSGFILGIGEYGARVGLLQTIINELIDDEYIVGIDKLIVDSKFGSKTEVAVKLLQAKINEGLDQNKKIPEDGVFGPLTEYGLIEKDIIAGLGKLNIT